MSLETEYIMAKLSLESVILAWELGKQGKDKDEMLTLVNDDFKRNFQKELDAIREV